jgi:ribonucleoside-diphosphate reductase alpha chain
VSCPVFQSQKLANLAHLSKNACEVLSRRYLLRDKRGNLVESPEQMFRRVAVAVAAAEQGYARQNEAEFLESEFYDLMIRLDFLPNSSILMNAGTPFGQLSACFVLPIEDTLESIFDSLKHMAMIQQTGGGVGFSFSRLRPQGDALRRTTGNASGPVSFMRVFDRAADTIKDGGKRRAANMAVLSVDHPDIIDFVRARSSEDALSTFGLSVAVTDDFMSRVRNDQEYTLVNPRNGEPVRTIRARVVFDLISETAWRRGDPGLVFIDEINRRNPVRHVGEIQSTNPCGELPLLAYESCTLGSINLSHMCDGMHVDWNKLTRVVQLAVRFLDDTIDITMFPLERIEHVTKSNRKVGLGVMGFADMLAKMRIPYDSMKAAELAEELMSYISRCAIETSIRLAEERGSFPNFSGSTWERMGYPRIRNATLTTVAPTGTLSIIAGCSSGIEPIFGISYRREMNDGTVLRETNPVFEQIAEQRGFCDERLWNLISKKGSIRNITEIPRDIREIFPTALDISPMWHVRVQAAFQKYCDNAVSKTVNLPEEATVGDVRDVFLLAHSLRCKGVTVFRYGSRKQQVLQIGSPVRHDTNISNAEAYHSGNCTIGSCVA